MYVCMSIYECIIQVCSIIIVVICMCMYIFVLMYYGSAEDKI